MLGNALWLPGHRQGPQGGEGYGAEPGGRGVHPCLLGRGCSTGCRAGLERRPKVAPAPGLKPPSPVPPGTHLPGTFKGTERSICTTGMWSTPGASWYRWRGDTEAPSLGRAVGPA